MPLALRVILTGMAKPTSSGNTLSGRAPAAGGRACAWPMLGRKP
jgi:hypothetical protein